MNSARRLFLLFLAITVLAWVLRAGLAAFAGYVLIGVYLFSRYLARSWIEQIETERTVERGEREIGDSLQIVIRIRNLGKLPIGWLLVEDLLPEFTWRVRPARLTITGRRIALLFLPPGSTRTLKYRVTFQARGYYQLGPAFVETGDVFGLHRRHRIVGDPAFVLVLPKILPLAGYEFSSQRPIGEIRLANRLFEDPTRTAGVRPYQLGDPLQRVHWRATARTGELHSRVFEPTSLAGATLLIDMHRDTFARRSEPNCSDLCITTACALAHAVTLINQPIGLASNGRDAADRIRDEAVERRRAEVRDFMNRRDARKLYESVEPERLAPLVVETRRGFDQFQKIREALGRLEHTENMTFARLIVEVRHRLPRDATVIAILAGVSVETSLMLGQLRRQGYAITAILVQMDEEDRQISHGRLAAEGVRDVRSVQNEDDLMVFGNRGRTGPAMYNVAVQLA